MTGCSLPLYMLKLMATLLSFLMSKSDSVPHWAVSSR